MSSKPERTEKLCLLHILGLEQSGLSDSQLSSLKQLICVNADVFALDNRAY